MMRTFGYARVSTIDLNLDTRLEALPRAGCDEIFQDKIPGRSTSQPAFDELRAKLPIGTRYWWRIIFDGAAVGITALS